MHVSRLAELVLYKAYAELKAEAARFYASFFMWIIEPIIYMGAFYIVFELLFQRGGPDFVPFLLCGLIVWKWFASTVVQGSNAILANTTLIQRVYVQKFIFPGTFVLTNTVRFFFVFVLFVIFLYIYGISPAISWLALPAILITQFLFITACSGLLSAVVPFFPDLKLLIEKFLMMGFFMSGVFFDIARMPEAYQKYLYMNPMAALIGVYRNVMLQGMGADWKVLGLIAMVSILGIVLAQTLMSRFDRLYPKVSMQ